MSLYTVVLKINKNVIIIISCKRNKILTNNGSQKSAAQTAKATRNQLEIFELKNEITEYRNNYKYDIQEMKMGI